MKRITTTHGHYPGTRLIGRDRFKRLYHFTSFESFVKIWLSGKLLFGNVQRVNDLQEVNFPVSAKNPQQWAVMQKFIELRLKYKQISLTMDFDTYIWGCMSTQMWAYYADKGQGVCIQLDYNKLPFSPTSFYAPVKYRECTNGIDLDPKISTIKDIKRFIKRQKSKIFFTKQFTWKGENEYRIVSDTDEFLDITDAISCIYVTNTESVNFEMLIKLINNKVPIRRLKFLDRNGLSIPVLTDAINERKEHDKYKNDINQIFLCQQIHDKIEECKGDENKSLLMPVIKFVK